MTEKKVAGRNKKKVIGGCTRGNKDCDCQGLLHSTEEYNV